MEAFEIDCRDCDGKNAVGVAVKVALVSKRGAIATGKDENRSLVVTAILNTIQYRALNKIARALHGLAVIRRTPGAAVDGRILVVKVECGGLVDV